MSKQTILEVAEIVKADDLERHKKRFKIAAAIGGGLLAGGYLASRRNPKLGYNIMRASTPALWVALYSHSQVELIKSPGKYAIDPKSATKALLRYSGIEPLPPQTYHEDNNIVNGQQEVIAQLEVALAKIDTDSIDALEA